jgi:cellulose synthase/poly-beta-1,6-N-acetylglucosamine synthase-like glycosyltransferase
MNKQQGMHNEARTTSGVGCVAIGRNEGERLSACLESLRSYPAVYVDSGSTDDSLQLAQKMRAEFVELDGSRPFSAARARNAGLRRLLELHPVLELVQFVDGDCQVQEGWTERATRELKERPDVAIVCGRRRERYPKVSIFNRLCDVEWNTPTGEAMSCGGDSMMRIAALREAGGFDETVVAGEEPELCSRLRKKGWKILRIDAEMTLHDAAMTRWGQWWRRQMRSGYGAMDAAGRFEVEEFLPQVMSVRVWTVGWLSVTACLSVVGGVLEGRLGVVVGVCAGIAMAVMQVCRVARWAGRRESAGVAMLYAVLNLVGKWGQLWGQVRFMRDRRRGGARLIEYKNPTDVAVTAATKQ